MNRIIIVLAIGLILCPVSEEVYAQGKKLTPQQETTINSYKDLIKQNQNSNHKVEIAGFLSKIAYIYWECEHYTEAIDFFKQSLEINKSLDNKNALKFIYNSLGMIYTETGKHDKALEMFSENVKTSRNSKQKSDLVSALINVSTAYENLKKYNEAITSLNEALSIAQEDNNIKLMQKCYSALADNYGYLGKNDKSIEYMTLYVSLDKALQKEEINLKDQKLNEIQSHSQHVENTLTSQIELLQKDKLIQSLKIREQEAQLKFERQLLETQNELQSEQEKQLRYERTFRQILMGGIIIISSLAIIIFLLYRKLKEKEKRLLESEEKFRKLFENSEDVLLIFDDSNIIDCNNACLKFLGFADKKQLISGGISSLLPPDQPDQSNSIQKAMNMLRNAYQEGYARSELLVKKNNNNLAYVDVSHTAITILGKKVLYSIWRDIDRQKKAENELNSYKEHLEELVRSRTVDLEKAKIKAEESDKLKSIFLANMSHEIKTPLNAIIGVSKMMLKYSADSFDEKQTESIKVIYDSGNRLLKLLDDILEYSEISAGIVDSTIISIQTEMLKQYIAQIALDSIGEKPIKFSISIAHDFPQTFNSDLNKILQILTNLIDNASKFTNQGAIHISLTKHLNLATFTVDDTGQGIDNEDIPKLFEGFKQLDDSASRKHNGTGLGLAISKGFVDLLGGSIKVESELNKGTSVSFNIPL
jgi:PAS domain S-box-containing protein